MSNPAKRYRVAQWATGNVGSRALRHIINDPSLELVGVWVHSAAKAGQDAGSLAGTAPTGVLATNSMDDILALKPDCVSYMPHVFNPEEVCTFLEAGINVVSTRMELQNPKALDPALYERLEAACQKGRSSVHASGSSPGFISEAVPLVLASIQRRFDYFTIDEFADCSSRNSPEMLFEMMGFAKKPGAANQAALDHARYSFGPSLQLFTTALGLPVEEFKTFGAVGLARRDVHIAAGVVPAGTIAAMKSTLAGYRAGKRIVSFTSNWFVSEDVETSDGEAWEFRSPSGWHLVMQGDSPLDLSISFPCALEDYAEMTPNLTANRPVNAIPFVCAATPGVKTTVDLPYILPRLG